MACLEAYNVEGTPFAVQLRTFERPQVYGAKRDGSGGVLLEDDLYRWSQQRGTNFIRVHGVAGVPGVGPAIVIDGPGWQEAAEAVIGAAELVVSECQYFTRGVIAELQACITTGRADRSVLLVPPRTMGIAGDTQPTDAFIRVAHADDLVTRPSEEAIFQDLLDRIARITAMRPRERLAHLEKGTFDDAVPISFAGVAAGFLGIAQMRARHRDADGAFFAADRAARAADKAYSLEESLDFQLGLAGLIGNSVNLGVALELLDRAEGVFAARRSELASEGAQRLRTSFTEQRIDWLSTAFETLLNEHKIEALARTARTQAEHATRLQNPRVTAQCLSWLAVAEVAAGNYPEALRQAHEAILIAHPIGDRFRVGFASFYAGNAHRAMGNPREAFEAYREALEALPQDRGGRIYAALMLSTAEMAEQLTSGPAVVQLYESARQLAQAMQEPDLLDAAEAGLQRVRGHG